jgi:N utilization substance protein A
MIGRAIVLVEHHQVSRIIGPSGQNTRLASKVCRWDIEVMTANQLESQIRRAKSGFRELDGVSDVVADSLVKQGFLSFDDLAVIEPDALIQMGKLTVAQADAIIEQAEEKAESESRFESRD